MAREKEALSIYSPRVVAKMVGDSDAGVKKAAEVCLAPFVLRFFVTYAPARADLRS